MSDELREQLADEQHAIWSHWMGYMFACGTHMPDGTWVMPADKARRWQRQMETPYTALTDKERESDRHQADKILAVVQPALAAALARAEAAETEGFHAAIISVLAVLRLHGMETIWREIADLCDTQALLAHARANDEIEFAGLDKWLQQDEGQP